MNAAMKSGLKVYKQGDVCPTHTVAVNAAMKSGLKALQSRYVSRGVNVAVNAAMKSGLKDYTATPAKVGGACSSECRDEKRTESPPEPLREPWCQCSSECRDEKRTERLVSYMVCREQFRVAVNAAMKSGLKVRFNTSSLTCSFSSSECRDEKRTESEGQRAPQSQKGRSSECRDEKRTESLELFAIMLIVG